jgi:hypothetical protein
MKKFLLAAVGFSSAVGVSSTQAAVVTFDVSGNLVPGFNATCAATCQLGGTIQIDTSQMYGANLGAVADVTVTGAPLGPFTYEEVVTSNTYLDIHLLIPGNANESLDLYLPGITTFIGYAGSSFTDLPTAPYGALISSPTSYWFVSGTLTPEATTPLPAALPLFATGLAGLGLLG